jgi:large subunit ribosomal protein L24
MKLKKGDTVQILKGKDRGKSGKVLRVLPEANRVLVDGLNLIKKHRKPKRQGEKGETITLPRPLQVSNVMLLCPSCQRPTRVGYRFDSEKKVRFCKRCAATIA